MSIVYVPVASWLTETESLRLSTLTIHATQYMPVVRYTGTSIFMSDYQITKALSLLSITINHVGHRDTSLYCICFIIDYYYYLSYHREKLQYNAACCTFWYVLCTYKL